MKIALYKRTIEEAYLPQWHRLLHLLRARGAQPSLLGQDPEAAHADFVISVGGDGTLLGAVHAVGAAQAPIVGLNFGHLGFLTSAGRDDIDGFVDDVLAGRYAIEERTLLDISWAAAPDGIAQHSYALNEAYVHRSDRPSLLKTALYVDGDLVADYDADGLIVATPTGSTAYSLSCGGPILTPNSGCFVATPIAAHTLTLRPIIVPDTARLRLVARARQAPYCIGIDSRTMVVQGDSEIHLARAPFTVRLARMAGQNFYTAIHEKLSWGR